MEDIISKLPSNIKYQILNQLNKDTAATEGQPQPATNQIRNIISQEYLIDLCSDIKSEHLSFFTKDRLHQLEYDGYFVVDDFLNDRDFVERVHNESVKQYQDQLLKPASMNKGADRWHDKQIRGDSILWIHRDPLKNNSNELNRPGVEIYESIPNVNKLLDRLDDIKNELDLVVPSFKVQKSQTQLAVYPSGGKYVKHRDSFFSNDQLNQRRITMIYYSNLNWTKGDGGELRLYTYNKNRKDLNANDKEQDHYIDIDPKADRLLIFLSPFMEHEVLECIKEPRVAITTWIY
ncbi:hypothetical protein CYY_010567 [Polysphondylium violaceum]|uniref:Fe2OG dioxygenase domain-containing protein n=1 Tax=Polysphondylium violaceum TaxID=133409 RepID=A0A8J4PJP8_9MYCE|nr:hypothetical protein CYY_010567 [Polysphondylium violaceum]